MTEQKKKLDVSFTTWETLMRLKLDLPAKSVDEVINIALKKAKMI